MKLNVRILKEAGYEEALYGASLYRRRPIEDMPRVVQMLSSKDLGHNKALEHIMVWLEVIAPRYFWVEADTYRMSSKQSEGTLDLFKKRQLCQADFEFLIPKDYLAELNRLREAEDYVELKAKLPEGFLQTREWCMSYKTLRNIILQRRNHWLPHWKVFVKDVLDQIEHPELLPEGVKHE